MPSFAARGTWERATTLSYLTTTLEIATRLPLFPEEMEVILKDDWRSANRASAIAAMLAGSVVGLLAYVLIAPYCAAVFSAAVSAVVMLIGSRTWPERFDFSLLQEEG